MTAYAVSCSDMIHGNAIVGQSGGPTSVINASLAGVIDGVRQAPQIGRLYGMRYAVEGFLGGLVTDLTELPPNLTERLKLTPGSALGSCRYKLTDDDVPQVLRRLEEREIRYLFLIGGNDTMDTVHRIEAYARARGYELRGVGIPKTVDNDLAGTYFTPGFPSAARYMALSVLQAGILARDMRRVDDFVVFQTIGRDAGWLAASTTLARRHLGDPPHLIYMPERVFDQDTFLAEVQRLHAAHGFVSIVCGEGITFADGTPVSASQTTDRFDNVEFGAMGGGSVALNLHRMITSEFGFRGEFQITESLPMCAADRAVARDREAAYACGQEAVCRGSEDVTGVMVTIMESNEADVAWPTGTIPLDHVARQTRPVPDDYLSSDGTDVTEAFVRYAAPLVGPMPEYIRLEEPV